jgi:predicted ATPase/DNA-binding SARP family transcriptional activator
LAGRPAVRVDVLGPLRLAVDGVPVEVRGPKRRIVLALLAVTEGRAVTADHLLDALWPAGPPDSARGALHSHVFRLRGHLGAAGERLETLDGAAYRLALGPDDLDAARARALLATARERRRFDPAAAAALLREARSLWRGPALGEFPDVPPLAVAAVGLERLRHNVTDLLVACAVEAGEAADVVGLAAEALAADPVREPAVLLLMRALAGAGQAPEALGTARAFRRRLADETGLDPSPALADLERAIAAGAPPATARPVVRPATPLLGRDDTVVAVLGLLSGQRLVTVVGPGGVGKTRVALEVAHRSGALAFLRLAPVTDPAAIPHALAAALDVRVVQGDVLAACTARLGEGPALLVVDNCEHLLDAVRDTVDALLAACPDLTVLTTTREPLGLDGECVYRLTPLPVPSDDARDEAALAQVPSVALFVDRATRLQQRLVLGPAELRRIAEVVRRLDGMPLAIELAAGRLTTFSPAELADRLDRSLDLLAGPRPTADARHRTLRAAVEWSYDLLPAHEQRLFRHLAVFVDGFDLATAEDVASELGVDGDPGAALAHLVDASMIDALMVNAGPSPAGTRYRMLETLRSFGVDRLAAAGEQAAAAARLVAWGQRLAEWINSTAATDDEPRADAALRREQANLRAAWSAARDSSAEDDAVAIVVALYEASMWRDLPELRNRAEELAGDPGLADHPRAATVLAIAAGAAYMRGDGDIAMQRACAALAAATDDEARGYGHRALALAHLARGEFAGTIRHERAAESLAPRPTDEAGVAALAATYAGDFATARAFLDRLAAAAVSPTLRAFTAYVSGELDSATGHPERAEERYTSAIALARSSGATFVGNIASVGLLAVLTDAGLTDSGLTDSGLTDSGLTDSGLTDSGRIADALRGYRRVVDDLARTGNWSQLWTALRNLARLLRRLGDEGAAHELEVAADHAPDAPPLGRPARPTAGGPVHGRVQALDVARHAIDRHLGAL